MSIQAMSWALEQQIVVDPVARHVLLILANYAGETGRAAFPSTARLARETGLSERTVQRKLSYLRAAGVIKLGNQAIVAARISRVDRRPTCYDLCIERCVAVTPRAEDTGCQRRCHRVTSGTPRGVAMTPEPPHEPSPEPPPLPPPLHDEECSGGQEIIWDPILADSRDTILQVAQGLPAQRVQDLADELAGALYAEREGRRRLIASIYAWLSRLRDNWGVGPPRLEYARELRRRRLGFSTSGSAASAAPPAPREVAFAALAEAKAAVAAGAKKSKRRD